MKKRFIIYDPSGKSYVRIQDGGWTSGHDAEDVNSYALPTDAFRVIGLFDSLKNCQVREVNKTVEITGTWCNGSTRVS